MNNPKFIQVSNDNTVKSKTDITPVLGKKHQWIQRLCLKVLKKLGASIDETNIEYKECINEIDVDEFISKQQILDQINEALSHRITPRTLLVGRANFNRIMKMELEYRPISFDAPLRLSDGKSAKIFGLHIHVVPWMEGFLILDKNIEE